MIPILGFSQKSSSTIDFPVSEIPDSLLENANSVIRSANFEMVVYDEKKITYTEKAVITILNKKSHHKSLNVYYNKFKKVKSIQAAIYDRNGRKIKAAGKKDIQDISLTDEGTIANDSRLKKINLIHVEFPYTLVYEYQIELNSSYFIPDWYPIPENNTSVQFSSCKVIAKGNQKILYKEKSIPGKAEERNSSEEKIKYWQVSNCKAIEIEHLSPHYSYLLPSICFASEMLSLDNVVNKVDSWESFSKFYFTLNKDHNDISKDLKQEIHRITSNANSDKEKIDLLYTFLQENTRYISIQLGVGGLKSFKGSFVEKNKYGDCKALTYFMKSLLEEVGIVAYPALIDSGDAPRPIENDFATHLFNHIILYVPKEDTWLECTSSSDYPGFVSSFIGGRGALLIKENGGGIVQTPPIEQSKINIKNTLDISNKESTEVSSELILKGKVHENFRAWKEFISDEEQLELFERYLECSIIENSLDLELITDLESSQVTIKTTYQPTNIISKSSKRIFLPVKSNIDFYSTTLPHTENRKQKIVIENEKEFIETTTVIIPEGYGLESLPEKVNINSDFGTFMISFEEKSGGIEITKKGFYNKGIFPARDYSELVEFHNSIKATNNLNVVLVIKK